MISNPRGCVCARAGGVRLSEEPGLVNLSLILSVTAEAEGEELRLGQRSKGLSVIFIPKLRLGSEVFGMSGIWRCRSCGSGAFGRGGCLQEGDFASVCAGESECVCVLRSGNR